MQGGLMGISEGHRRTSVDAYGSLAGLEINRNAQNEALDQQKKQRQAAAVSGAVGTGTAVAMVAGGPAGWAVGIGMLAVGLLF